MRVCVFHSITLQIGEERKIATGIYNTFVSQFLIIIRSGKEMFSITPPFPQVFIIPGCTGNTKGLLYDRLK